MNDSKTIVSSLLYVTPKKEKLKKLSTPPSQPPGSFLLCNTYFSRPKQYPMTKFNIHLFPLWIAFSLTKKFLSDWYSCACRYSLLLTSCNCTPAQRSGSFQIKTVNNWSGFAEVQGLLEVNQLIYVVHYTDIWFYQTGCGRDGVYTYLLLSPLLLKC